MKIISLNTFAGTVFEPLMAFVERHAADTDVFCFQEIMRTDDAKMLQTPKNWRVNLLDELTKSLPMFEPFFTSMADDYKSDPDLHGHTQIGLATFVRRTMPVSEHGSLVISEEIISTPARTIKMQLPLLFVKIVIQNTPLTICSVHGIPSPGDKRDSPERMEQSGRILDIMQKQAGEKIIVGDFNLNPDTESVRLFERAGFRNLIREYNIPTTRGSHHRVLHPEHKKTPEGFQEYADYTFVSAGITVKTFEVPDLPLSDHLPMMLDIDIPALPST